MTVTLTVNQPGTITLTVPNDTKVVVQGEEKPSGGFVPPTTVTLNATQESARNTAAITLASIPREGLLLLAQAWNEIASTRILDPETVRQHVIRVASTWYNGALQAQFADAPEAQRNDVAIGIWYALDGALK